MIEEMNEWMNEEMKNEWMKECINKWLIDYG